jgi:hypothetical protein
VRVGVGGEEHRTMNDFTCSTSFHVMTHKSFLIKWCSGQCFPMCYSDEVEQRNCGKGTHALGENDAEHAEVSGRRKKK